MTAISTLAFTNVSHSPSVGQSADLLTTFNFKQCKQVIKYRILLCPSAYLTKTSNFAKRKHFKSTHLRLFL